MGQKCICDACGEVIPHPVTETIIEISDKNLTRRDLVIRISTAPSDVDICFKCIFRSVESAFHKQYPATLTRPFNFNPMDK